MKNSILCKLNKKARPDGYFNLKCFNYKAGIRGYKESQVCNNEGKYTTPWIHGRICSLMEYNNKMYGKVDKALEGVFHTVASECKELELLVPKAVPRNLDKENQLRMSASAGSSLSVIEKRKMEILIHLSEMRTDIETVDTALQHHLEKAEKVVLKHVADYWSGLLKAAGGNEFPSYPDIFIPEVNGKKVYEKHLSNIKMILSKALRDNYEEV